jgi:hypothetical protein
MPQVENVTTATPVAGTVNAPESEPPASTSTITGSPQWMGVVADLAVALSERAEVALTTMARNGSDCRQTIGDVLRF